MANNTNFLALIRNHIKNAKGFERLLNKVKIISVANGKCTAEYTVEEDVTNGFGKMHGGYSATLLEAISCYALFSLGKTTDTPSVPIQMHLIYAKAPKLGEEVIIEAKTVSNGNRFGYLSADIRTKTTRELLMSSLHTKYNEISKK